jgi:Na+-driven multidrug efflux pump
VLVCSVFCGITLGVLLTVSSGIFLELYNTDDNVKSLAAYMMIISGVYMPFYAFNNSSYFTIRSGGSVGITFIMDSGFMCLFMLPVSFIVSRFTSVDIYALFVICQGAEALKATISFFMLKKSSWTKRLVGEKN